MEQNKATEIFEALSSPIRLNIFKLLVKYSPKGLVAGQISTELELPANNLSFHLKILLHASLIQVEQEGRFLRYRANIEIMLSVIKYLTDECCCNNKDVCIELRKKSGIKDGILPD